jgi:hypothetical protein
MSLDDLLTLTSVPGLLGGGGEPGAAYANLLINTYGASEVWRLTDMVDATIIASSNTARNGTATGWDLTAPNAKAGPVTGEEGLAPYSDGSNDYGDILTSNGSTGLVDIWDGTEASFLIWSKRPSWIGSTDELFEFQADASNRLLAFKDSGQKMNIRFIGGGVTRTFQTGAQSTTNWQSYGIAVSVTGNVVYATLDGVQVGSNLTAVTWVGALAVAFLGAFSAVPQSVWDGNMAYAAIKFGTPIWTVADYAAMHAAVS